MDPECKDITYFVHKMITNSYYPCQDTEIQTVTKYDKSCS